MSILVLKTDQAESYVGLYEDESVRVEKSFEVGRDLARILLKTVEDICKETGIDVGDISSIVCYAGPGSFTGLRISHAYANALSYALSVPIVSATGEAWVEKGLSDLRLGKNHVVITPAYGAEPHITTPRTN
jgi:tRNA threonylcarbamoyladenosine biosynthesis protein TsaB